MLPTTIPPLRLPASHPPTHNNPATHRRTAWIIIDSEGKRSFMHADKRSITHRLGLNIPIRDLRLMDFNLLTSDTGSIMVGLHGATLCALGAPRPQQRGTQTAPGTRQHTAPERLVQPQPPHSSLCCSLFPSARPLLGISPALPFVCVARCARTPSSLPWSTCG